MRCNFVCVFPIFSVSLINPCCLVSLSVDCHLSPTCTMLCFDGKLPAITVLSDLDVLAVFYT